MFPTLMPGQSILVNRLTYLITKPKTGEIIAANDPRDGKILIKRIAKIDSAKQNLRFFVLGDNKSESTDSRAFGWITKKDIIGKVVYPQYKFSI